MINVISTEYLRLFFLFDQCVMRRPRMTELDLESGINFYLPS